MWLIFPQIPQTVQMNVCLLTATDWSLTNLLKHMCDSYSGNQQSLTKLGEEEQQSTLWWCYLCQNCIGTIATLCFYWLVVIVSSYFYLLTSVEIGMFKYCISILYIILLPCEHEVHYVRHCLIHYVVPYRIGNVMFWFTINNHPYAVLCL